MKTLYESIFDDDEKMIDNIKSNSEYKYLVIKDIFKDIFKQWLDPSKPVTTNFSKVNGSWQFDKWGDDQFVRQELDFAVSDKSKLIYASKKFVKKVNKELKTEEAMHMGGGDFIVIYFNSVQNPPTPLEFIIDTRKNMLTINAPKGFLK